MIKKILFLVTGLIFFLAVILPLVSIVYSSFFPNGVFSFDNYLLLANVSVIQLALKSAVLAAAVGLLATVLGGFFAFTLTKTDLPLRNGFKLALLTPLFLSPYITAVAWVDFFVLLGISHEMIYSSFSVIFILTIIFTPLAMIILSAAFANLNSGYEEAGLQLAGARKTIFKIVFPMIKPALLSSFILVFVLAISEFAAPSFLGVHTITTEIFTQFAAFYNHEQAVALAMMLIAVCIGLLLTERGYLGSAPFLTISPKAGRQRRTELRRSKPPLLLIHAAYLFISVLMPALVLLVQSFSREKSVFTEAFRLLQPAIASSALYAFIASLLLVLFGFVFACIAEREKVKAVNAVLLMAFGIPSTVLGVALLRFYNSAALDVIYGSFWIIVIAYLGRFIFISEKLIANGIRQIPRSLEEAADMLGVSSFRKITRINIPLLAESLFGAFLIGFIFSLNEVAAVMLVYPPGSSLMPVKVFTIMANAPLHLTSAMSLIQMLLTLAFIGLLFGGYQLLKSGRVRP